MDSSPLHNRRQTKERRSQPLNWRHLSPLIIKHSQPLAAGTTFFALSLGSLLPPLIGHLLAFDVHDPFRAPKAQLSFQDDAASPILTIFSFSIYAFMLFLQNFMEGIDFLSLNFRVSKICVEFAVNNPSFSIPHIVVPIAGYCLRLIFPTAR